jgi:hypothetical protein
MSAALVEMGFQRPKIKSKMSLKDMCITTLWAVLAVMVGMGVVSSMQAVNPAVAETSSVVQGL